MSKDAKTSGTVLGGDNSFRLLVEGIEDYAIILLDPEGRVASWNAGAELFKGYKADEILGKHFGLFFPRDAVQQGLPDQALRTAAKEGRFEDEGWRVRKDGSKFWAQVVLRALRDTDGILRGFSAIIRDATECKQAEDALGASELLYHTLVEQLPQALFRVDCAGRITFTNSRYCEIMGRPREALIGKTDFDLFPPELAAKYRADNERVMETGEIFEDVERHQRLDGSDMFVHVLKSPLRDAEGQVVGLQGLFWDVTTRKRAQDALAAANKRLQSTLANMAQGYYALDSDWRVVAVNDVAEKHFGKPSAELIGGTLEQATQGRIPDNVREGIQQVMASGQPQHFEVESKIRPGTWAVDYICPRAGGVEVYFRDITARKRAEQLQLLSAAILEILNRPLTLREATDAILARIKMETGFDAVGIRLQEDGDFPYFGAEGFDRDFLLAENSLVTRTESGSVCRDAEGKVCLECTCGLVLAGKCGPPSEHVTAAGSVWTNDSVALIDSLSHRDPRRNPRNRCVHEGYLSVALIPIRVDGQIIGLLHLNDRHRNRFTPEMIRFFEGLAASFGIAVKRKRAEAALRESNERLKKVLEVETVGVMFWDLTTGCLVDANDTFLNLMGYSRHDVEARELTWQKLTPPEYREVSLAEVGKFQTTGRIGPYEKEYLRKDGTRHWFVFAGSSLGNSRCVEFCVDIADRKKAEAALRESEKAEHILNQRLKTLQDAFARLAAVKTLDEIMAVARTAARRLTNADGATFVLRDGDKCFYADEDAIAPLWKGQRFPMSICISGWVMLNQQAVMIEDIYADPRIPADAYRPTFVKSLAMVPIRAAEPLGAIGNYWAAPHQPTPDEINLLRSLADGVAVAMENVQSYHLLEQRVQERTAELRAANRELDAFAYAVSHDLRAPLRAMNGFSQALKEDYGPVLQGEAREFLDEIVQASRKMSDLIDGLLQLSRMTRGELRRDAVDMSALALRILDELAQGEPNRCVTWMVKPGLTTRGDARMIEAVLTNLLGNAWKYTAKTAGPRIEFGADGDGRYFVRDNGAGFDMKHAERLFQPFQRLHRQDEFPGIGIGLATVQRIIQRHGGVIEAASEPGKGATFRFSLSPKKGNDEGENKP